MSKNRKVIAGPAGHWYALVTDWQFGETLVGLPMTRDEDQSKPPMHPSDMDDPWVSGGWYEITEPAPETDDAAIIAELKTDAAS